MSTPLLDELWKFGISKNSSGVCLAGSVPICGEVGPHVKTLASRQRGTSCGLTPALGCTALAMCCTDVAQEEALTSQKLSQLPASLRSPLEDMVASPLQHGMLAVFCQTGGPQGM